jgi:hypothetical protein
MTVSRSLTGMPRAQKQAKARADKNGRHVDQVPII